MATLALALLALAVAGCSRQTSAPQISTPPQAPLVYPDLEPQRVALRPVALYRLDGWQQDRVQQVLPALQQSCRSYLKMPANKPLGKTALGGYAGDWHPVCKDLLARKFRSDAALRSYIEQHFNAYLVSSNKGDEGTFTGYYTAHVRASLRPSRRYATPLYAAPKNWKDLKGNPGLTRQAIEQGALAGKGLEVVWLDDPVDAFILHIQGSGVATLPDGRTVSLRYAGNNGHKFKSIHKAMAAQGYDKSKEGLTMTAVASWLKRNPAKARRIMWQNPRFIYFKVDEKPQTIGAMGIPLTATRSLAVDPKYIPLGVPLWLNTSFLDEQGKRHAINRLMVAQDTGSAIKGAIRGDFFWGAGPEAQWAASRMKNPGRYAILLPKNQRQGLPTAQSTAKSSSYTAMALSDAADLDLSGELTSDWSSLEGLSLEGLGLEGLAGPR